MSDREFPDVIRPYEVFDTLLPVDGSQDTYYLSIGIEFGPFFEGSKLRGARLPAGWTLVYHRKSNMHFLLDDKKRKRIRVHIKNNAHMRPIRRFDLGRLDHFETHNTVATFCLWGTGVPFGTKPRVIMSEEFVLPDRQQHKDVHEERFKIYEQQTRKTFLDWLGEHYPRWEDNSAYWDD